MLINDVCKATNLTKKAIEYYIQKKLVNPDVLENGYRDFSDIDIEKLKKIAVLRKLDVGTEAIRSVLADQSQETIRNLAVLNRIRLQREKAKQALLDRLSVSQDWDEINSQIEERSITIAERLLDAFPGYYGRFISLHFARFLDMPIETHEQQEAYEEIIRFLDGVPAMAFPEDVQDLMTQSTKNISAESMSEINEKTKQSIENPEVFLSENKEMLDWYLAYKKSDEYKNSPACRLQALLKEFSTSSGYYHVFIPAMKKLSPSYADYYSKLETANEKLLSRYPEIKNLDC